MKNLSISLNPQKLRFVLGGAILLIMLASAAGVYFLTGMLESLRAERAKAYNDLQVSQQQVNNVQSLEGQITKYKTEIDRAKQLFSTDKLYAYQDKVISDVGVYAIKNKMNITTISFSSTVGAAAPAAAAPTAAPGAVPSVVAPTLVPFNIALTGDTSFNNVMSFIYDIEHNLTQMRIVSIALTPDAKDASMLSAPSISLEVYIRSGS
jgi:hypothetical protein